MFRIWWWWSSKIVDFLFKKQHIERINTPLILSTLIGDHVKYRYNIICFWRCATHSYVRYTTLLSHCSVPVFCYSTIGHHFILKLSTMFANPFQFKPIGYKYQPYSKASFFHVYRNTRRKTYIHAHIKCVWIENSVVLECNFFLFFRVCCSFLSFFFSIVFELELAGRFESYVFPTPFIHGNTCEHTA